MHRLIEVEWNIHTESNRNIKPRILFIMSKRDKDDLIDYDSEDSYDPDAEEEEDDDSLQQQPTTQKQQQQSSSSGGGNFFEEDADNKEPVSTWSTNEEEDINYVQVGTTETNQKKLVSPAVSNFTKPSNAKRGGRGGATRGSGRGRGGASRGGSQSSRGGKHHSGGANQSNENATGEQHQEKRYVSSTFYYYDCLLLT
jgi:hypothetical protein